MGTSDPTASVMAANDAWARLKRSGLSAEAVQMAKEMGLNPRKLAENIASRRSEPWKGPTEDWIRDLFAKRQSKKASGRQ